MIREDVNYVDHVGMFGGLKKLEELKDQTQLFREKREGTIHLIETIFEHMSVNKYQQALNNFEELIEIEPEIFHMFPDLYYQRGLCFMMAGIPTSAGICFDDLYRCCKYIENNGE